ncbi:MAG TPA: glycosyltransferase [Verrucomicrobiae bacterium]|nr:glycosyltransferase [Verrucomicrobiae bacterium]
MKIALAHDFLRVYGGAERVLKELHELYPDAPIFTTVADEALVREHFPKADIRTSYLQTSWRKKINQLFLLAIPAAIESLDFTGFDVVISSSGAFAHGIITSPDTRHISYCHSPMRYAWDWHAEFMREKNLDKGGLKTFLANEKMSKLRFWDAVSAKRVDTWVANSKTVAARIQQYYRQPSIVINPPVDTQYFNPAKLGEPVKRGIHMLSISRLGESKKVDQMIEACHQAGVPLRIAGQGSDHKLRAQAQALKADVTFLGPISEEVKRRELASAAAFLFAAEDDFGIAPVEAMAMGTPVIAFGKGGATETVVQELTGILYPEQTVESLLMAIRMFKEKGVKGTEETIRQRTELFSPEKFRTAIEQLVHGNARKR